MTAGNTPEPGQPIARIGRMAVVPERRRQGIGARILAILESVAQQHEVRDAVLHAQTYVKDFYAAYGYAGRGRDVPGSGHRARADGQDPVGSVPPTPSPQPSPRGRGGIAKVSYRKELPDPPYASAFLPITR